MLCQECKQKQASLHFTKIVNGQKTEFHICETCAKEMGEHYPGTNSFSIHQLLSGLLHFDQPLHPNQETLKPAEEISCSKCNMTYETFTRVGRFGCSNCYQSFKSKLEPIFKRVHSGNHLHSGKLPKRIGKDIHRQRKIRHLKEEMKNYIEMEEFEKAAELRDQIRALDYIKPDEKEG